MARCYEIITGEMGKQSGILQKMKMHVDGVMDGYGYGCTCQNVNAPYRVTASRHERGSKEKRHSLGYSLQVGREGEGLRGSLIRNTSIIT